MANRRRRAPLRDPSLRSWSLRSAQPASAGEGITEVKGISSRTSSLSDEEKMGLPLSTKPHVVV
jgi:hypothetical protein